MATETDTSRIDREQREQAAEAAAQARQDLSVAGPAARRQQLRDDIRAGLVVGGQVRQVYAAALRLALDLGVSLDWLLMTCKEAETAFKSSRTFAAWLAAPDGGYQYFDLRYDQAKTNPYLFVLHQKLLAHAPLMTALGPVRKVANKLISDTPPTEVYPEQLWVAYQQWLAGEAMTFDPNLQALTTPGSAKM